MSLVGISEKVRALHVKVKVLRCKITNKCVEVVVEFIDAFLEIPQHVSASSCHHQGVVVP
jgi:hypothetical protein